MLLLKGCKVFPSSQLCQKIFMRGFLEQELKDVVAMSPMFLEQRE